MVIFTEILQNISILIASITAIYGINAWRKEHVGKRRIDLAEEVLALAYEIKDKISFIRNPFVGNNEGSSRKKSPRETPEKSRILDNAYVVFERYNREKEVFDRFFKIQFKYLANFGRSSEKSFRTIHNIINKVFLSSRALGTHYWDDNISQNLKDEELSKHLDKAEKYEGIIWEIDKNDEINKQLDEVIKEFERISKKVNKIKF